MLHSQGATAWPLRATARTSSFKQHCECLNTLQCPPSGRPTFRHLLIASCVSANCSYACQRTAVVRMRPAQGHTTGLPDSRVPNPQLDGWGNEVRSPEHKRLLAA
jgi:hypothetical protein